MANFHGRSKMTVSEKFEGYFEKKENDCWIWTGGTDKKGYGVFHDNGTHQVRAHRFSWALYRGPIPEGLHIDHSCVNPPCVNPDHLEPMTLAENNRRSQQRKTHCRKMHDLSLPGAIISGSIARCVKCRQTNVAKSNAKRRKL